MSRAKKGKCRYCREGHVPNEEGEHGIVKSIIQAKISIRKCADYPTAPLPAPDVRGGE
jgi:hypothetical protein